jgi:hypothetical protein
MIMSNDLDEFCRKYPEDASNAILLFFAGMYAGAILFVIISMFTRESADFTNKELIEAKVAEYNKTTGELQLITKKEKE